MLIQLLLATLAVQSPSPRIDLLQTPNSGIQPRAAVDEKGVLHLVYFTGDPKAGNLDYVRSIDGGKTFSPPLRVNTSPASAVAVGNVRGAQLALGRKSRIHVAWNGAGPGEEAPMLYTSLDDTGTKFAPERDVAGSHHGLDGGGAVAADAAGNVWVVWHAPDGGKGEENRRVFVARSKNDGATFDPELAASDKSLGVCPCCGLGAMATESGALAILYRTAQGGKQRDTHLLFADEAGGKFREQLVDEWRVQACVMSTCSLTRSSRGLLGAFESDGQIRFAALGGNKLAVIDAPPFGGPGRKHPSIACGADGSVLLAWTEGMGWEKGGALDWQLLLRGTEGTLIEDACGRSDGIPPWSLVQAVHFPDGHFAILR